MPATKKNTANTTNTNYYMVLALISLLVVGVTGLVGKMLVGAIIHDTKVLSAKNTANKRLDANLDAAPQLVSSYKSLSATPLAILGNALPNTEDFPALISMMENIAGQSGVVLTAVQPDATAGLTAGAVATDSTADAASTAGAGAATTGSTSTSEASDDVPAPTPKTFAFTVGVRGSYASVMRFFTNLELSARPVRVGSVNLTGSNANLTATFSMTTYYMDKATLPFSTKVIK